MELIDRTALTITGMKFDHQNQKCQRSNTSVKLFYGVHQQFVIKGDYEAVDLGFTAPNPKDP
jgi:outer membrane receptor for ferrienterochelin and colicin